MAQAQNRRHGNRANTSTQAFGFDDENRNEETGKVTIKERIMRLNYYVALFALFLKTPLGDIVSSCLAATISAFGIVAFAKVKFAARGEMMGASTDIIYIVSFIFALLLSLGAIKAEIARVKYTPEFKQKALNYNVFQKIWYGFFCDINTYFVVFAFLVDATLSIRGFAPLFKTENLLSFDAIDLYAFALFGPVSVYLTGSSAARRMDTDKSFNDVFEAYGNDFSEFVSKMN